MIDLARIHIKAGDGGDGAVHFHREKFVPKGGPDGGDGGDGGDIYLVADRNLDHLIEFTYQKQYLAQDGEDGMKDKKYGKAGEDMTIRLPVGTTVWEIPQDYFDVPMKEREDFERVMVARKLLADFDQDGKRVGIARGGKGGRGNAKFASSRNQTPCEAEAGTPGEEKWILLELTVVADIGIIGLPNVGKSSLLKAMTAANPKIAAYPFTTLAPNLGVWQMGDKPMVLVDVPGVVEEAWEGKGIGPWFLRHIERTKALVHVLAPAIEYLDGGEAEKVAEQLWRDYETVRSEIEKYSDDVVEKPEVVVVNKMELLSVEQQEAIKKYFKKKKRDVHFVSAGMQKVNGLVEALQKMSL